MQPELYERFIRLKKVGRKAEATAILAEFIASFRSFGEKQTWTRDFLEGGAFGHKIRHELYEGVIFPVLLEGYRKEDLWSIEWLARTIESVYNNPALPVQIEFKNDSQLYRQLYALAPTEALRIQLLKETLSYFSYSQHEWDFAGWLLWGADGATEEECAMLLQAVEEARQLDTDRSRADYIDDYEHKVRKHLARLAARDAKTQGLEPPPDTTPQS